MPMMQHQQRGTRGRPHVWFTAVMACAALACGGEEAASRPIEIRESARAAAEPAAVEALNRPLVELSAEYARGTGELAGLLDAAARRHDALAKLIEEDPRAALQASLPDAVRAGMPEELRARLEQRVEVEGELEVFYEDYPDGSARLRHFLKGSGQRIALHLAGETPALLSGTRVRASGMKLDAAMAVESDPGILTLAAAGGSTVSNGGTAAPALSALGEQRTLLVLVNFADAPAQPYTVEQARSVMFDTTSRFFLESSFQQAWLSGDVVGWFTIAARSTECDTAAIASQAKSAAAAAGVNLAAYAHLVYAFPQNACGFWGNSTLGGSPSEAWITGRFELGVTAHELGHGMGLFHSHALECGAAGTLGASCTSNEYGDMLDMMGSSPSAHYNALQKERLGWLNSGVAAPPITTVASDGTYALEPYALAGKGPKALKILKSTDPSTGRQSWYYVEARQPVGFDADLASYPNATTGVLIHSGTPGGNSSYLLDMTPESGTTFYWDWRDPALVVGQTFRDPAAGVTITTESVTASGAAVSVRFDTTMVLATDRASYRRGDVVTLKATVRSGSGGLANTGVTFTVTKPGGAVVTARATTGTDGTATYKLRLRRDDPVGTWQAGGVADGGSAPRGGTSFTVQ